MARKTANDDPLAPVTLAVGQEDLLLDRAVQEVVAAAKAADADTDVRDLTPDQLQPGTLAELTSPSLFAERKVVVVRNAQDLSRRHGQGREGLPRFARRGDHARAAARRRCQGQGAAGRRAQGGGAGGGLPEDDQAGGPAGLRPGEFRSSGRSATPEACQALCDAIGSDLRELASAVSQLVADVEGTIDEAIVGRYYTGRAEASSFTVADRAVEGRTAEALEALRWSLATGVAPVMITSALAQGVRAIGKLSSARGGRPADLARELGMPPWKIDRVRQQMRGWTPDGVAVAMRAVAEADAGVKGGGDDPEYALEKAVVVIARAARSRGARVGARARLPGEAGTGRLARPVRGVSTGGRRAPHEPPGPVGRMSTRGRRTPHEPPRSAWVACAPKPGRPIRTGGRRPPHTHRRPSAATYAPAAGGQQEEEHAPDDPVVRADTARRIVGSSIDGPQPARRGKG